MDLYLWQTSISWCRYQYCTSFIISGCCVQEGTLLHNTDHLNCGPRCPETLGVFTHLWRLWIIHKNDKGRFALAKWPSAWPSQTCKKSQGLPTSTCATRSHMCYPAGTSHKKSAGYCVRDHGRGLSKAFFGFFPEILLSCKSQKMPNHTNTWGHHTWEYNAHSHIDFTLQVLGYKLKSLLGAIAQMKKKQTANPKYTGLSLIRWQRQLMSYLWRSLMAASILWRDFSRFLVIAFAPRESITPE